MGNWRHALAGLIIVPLMFVTAQAASGARQYKIIMMMGNVRVAAGGTVHAASFNEKLSGGETIITGSGSFADISMGGKGYMRIQENSKVALASLKKRSDDPDLDMENGNVIVIMSKLKKDDSYGVKTSTNVASVRGTMFQVAGDEAASEINVFSGTVLVNPVSNGEIQRQIAEMVTEGRSLSLNRDLVMDLMAKKKTMKLSEIRREVRDSFMKQIREIQATPDYKNQSAELRREIDDRIRKFKQELKDRKLDPDSLKEKIRNERERQKSEMKRIRDEMRGK
ncbi:MAG TPA: FecR domain-containing protein [Spirochaetota bacterium]|nr:FecR domain-containing protein [Spirochaetota bacterium]HPC40294.1 FecR domain-containing protein [Spirochaetota bacterium]HPL15337.1 FecR domain-containing protein [Spirochaetota bacterium]HQF07232.1 FecR domain-containing protein [Spirochaetota bacterium]HQH96132.1 FecR domain-containing protein [Spirochaetota bacterium]